MTGPSTCKLGPARPQVLRAGMVARALAFGRGGLQIVYAAAFEGLLAALDAGETISFAAARGPKIRVTLRLPERLCARIRARVDALTLKLTDFVCAAIGRTVPAHQGA